jgi:hypothetical protein
MAISKTIVLKTKAWLACAVVKKVLAWLEYVVVKKVFVDQLSPLLLQQQHVQRNEARNYKWEMDIFGE